MSSFKSPAQTAAAVANAAKGKNDAAIPDLIVLSFLAGAYIAFGGLLAIVASAGMLKAGAPIGLEKFVFGGVFPVGLIMVVLAGSELFTGNVMFMTLGVLDKKAGIGGLAKNWIFSWIFNFIGALFVAYVLAFMGGITPADTAAPTYAISAKAIAVAEGKVTMPFLTAVIKGIGCNWLVCVAVWMANASDDVIGKILAIWFPIMAFVCIGFEHSVANMFFIPLGMFLGAEGVNWGTIIINNLIPVTIGNIIGGAVFVACIYWFTYLRNAEE